MKFSKPLLITKLKATGVHLSMSLVVFVYLVYQIYFNWYPQPYFEVDGGWQGIRLVAAVDLVLGPFITFLIFDLSKSRRAIVFDLITIVIIQFAALAYGVYLTYAERPVAIVMIDEFVVTATMEQFNDSLESEDELKRFSDEKPPFIYALLPQTTEGLNELGRLRIEDKVLDHARIGLYQPKSAVKDALKERQLIFYDRMEFYKAENAFEKWLQDNQKSRDEILIARFAARYGNVWLVFDLDGKLVSYFW